MAKPNNTSNFHKVRNSTGQFSNRQQIQVDIIKSANPKLSWNVHTPPATGAVTMIAGTAHNRFVAVVRTNGTYELVHSVDRLVTDITLEDLKNA